MLKLSAFLSHLFTCKKMYVVLFVNVRQENKVACGKGGRLKKDAGLFLVKKNPFKYNCQYHPFTTTGRKHAGSQPLDAPVCK